MNPDTGKDLELLDSCRRPNRADSIHDIIARLEHEIARGKKVYTSDELAKLEAKLAEYKELLRVLSF